MTVINSDTRDVFTELDNFGRYQALQYFLICLPLMMVAMMNVNYVFVAGEVEFRCLIRECEDENSTSKSPVWWPANVDGKCLKPELDLDKFHKNYDKCSNVTFLEPVDICQEWIYENNNSMVAELNLGCDSWKSTLVGSVHNAAMIVSMIIVGIISDKYGRKPATILCCLGGLVGIVKIYMRNFYAYLAIEFLESILSSGLYTVAIVLMIEVGGQSKRVLAGVIFSYATYVGEVLFGFIAIGVPYWKHLVIIIYCPTILFVVYVVLLKESTRWQMLKNKSDDARKTFQLIAKMNNLEVSSIELDTISNDTLRKMFDIEEEKVEEKIKDAIASREIMIRLAVTSFCFFSAGFIYYGLMVHSVLLPGSKYLNFALVSLTSFPGDLLAFFTFTKYGRRVSLQCGFLSCGIFCLAQAYVPESLPWLKIVLFMFGKLGVALCFTGMFTYSLELFPTSVRGSLVGVGNTASRIGSMLSPLTPLLTSDVTAAVPALLFASAAVAAAAVLSFTPETKNLPLFDTIAQVEDHKHVK